MARWAVLGIEESPAQLQGNVITQLSSFACAYRMCRVVEEVLIMSGGSVGYFSGGAALLEHLQCSSIKSKAGVCGAAVDGTSSG